MISLNLREKPYVRRKVQIKAKQYFQKKFEKYKPSSIASRIKNSKMVKEKAFISKSWWKKSNQNTVATLGKLSKAFMLPIALLPVAGICLGVGATISSKVGVDTGAWYFGNFLNQIGSIAFANLPILFCVSVAMAYSEGSGLAALTAVVGFLVFNAIQAAFLTPEIQHFSYTMDVYGHRKAGDPAVVLLYHNLTISGASSAHPELLNSNNILPWLLHSDYKGAFTLATKINISSVSSGTDKYKLLFYTGSLAVQNKLLTQNLGVLSLNTGVFGGIFVGALSAWLYRRFRTTQLPSAFAFFSGEKLVPITAFIFMIPLSFIFMFVWPIIGNALAWFGENSGKLPGGLDSFIFEIFERSLVPFGLHHVFYAPLWWTQAGGSVPDIIQHLRSDPEHYKAFLNDINGYKALSHVDINNKDQALALITDWTAHLKGETLTAVGDQTIMYKVIADPYATFTMFQHLGLNLGRFQSGKYPFMMFGLPFAALAMWFAVPKQNRKKVMGIYFSAAFTCLLTGVTEPIEFTFLFVAPWLFYGVHMPMCAVSFLLMGLLHTHVSMTISGGWIDFIIFGIIPFAAGKGTNFYNALWVGAIYAPVYFIVFYTLIRWRNIQLPGRGSNTDALFTKKDYKSKKGISGAAGVVPNDEKNMRPDVFKAKRIIEFLGGEENIESVDACASRLRLVLKDNSIVDQNGIKSLGGCAAIITRGTNVVQCIYGGEQNVIMPNMKDLLAAERAKKKAMATQTAKVQTA